MVARANGGIDTDPTVRTMSITVLSAPRVNHAPEGTDNAVTALEDVTYTVQIADFGLTDPNDPTQPEHSAFRHDRHTARGWHAPLERHAVTAGQMISANLIGGGQLTYSSPANANGNNLDSLTFQVQDDGGTARWRRRSGSDAEHADVQCHRGQRCPERRRSHADNVG